MLNAIKDKIRQGSLDGILAGFIFATLLYQSFNSGIYSDAQEHAVMGAKLINGELPGIDYMSYSSFIGQHLYYGLHAVIFGLNLYVLKASAVLIFVLLIFSYFKLMTSIGYSRVVAFLSAALFMILPYSRLFLLDFIHYNNTVAFLGFAFIGLLFLKPETPLQRKKLILFFIGLLYGISASTRIHILALMPIFLFITYLRLFHIGSVSSFLRTTKELLVFSIAGFAIPNIPVFYILSQSLDKVIWSNFVHHAALMKIWAEEEFAGSIITINFHFLKEFLFGGTFHNFVFSHAFFTALAISGFTVVFTKKKGILRAKTEKERFIIYSFIFLIPLLISYWRYGMFMYYYTHILFLLASAVPLAIETLSRHNRSKLLLKVITTYIIFLTTAFFIYYPVKNFVLGRQKDNNKIEVIYAMADSIKRNSSAGDIVFADHNLPVLLSGRKYYHDGGAHRTIAWWNLAHQDTTEESLKYYPKEFFKKGELLKDFKDKKIKLVLLENDLEYWGKFYGLDKILQENYKIVDKMSDFTLYKLNSDS